MREILFRGKDVAGNWRFGFPMVFCEEFATIADSLEYAKSVKIETLGQFTGLYDKNGTKIFEGDIVNVDLCGHTFKSEVCFEDGGFCVKHPKNGAYICLVQHYTKQDFEVIGNIHECKK